MTQLVDGVQPLVMNVAGIELSGLAAEPAGSPRGLVFALHGGGSRAAYFHSPVDPSGSLLGIAAALGWQAVALDRRIRGVERRRLARP
ncbi:hypothetical protein [Streptomyces sp. KL116D]|uniref:hypothetical protein n=1 Tax=Streptomyces sp. KL116D TaxID=3045152 RepID=UPI0035561F58